MLDGQKRSQQHHDHTRGVESIEVLPASRPNRLEISLASATKQPSIPTKSRPVLQGCVCGGFGKVVGGWLMSTTLNDGLRCVKMVASLVSRALPVGRWALGHFKPIFDIGEVVCLTVYAGGVATFPRDTDAWDEIAKPFSSKGRPRSPSRRFQLHDIVRWRTGRPGGWSSWLSRIS